MRKQKINHLERRGYRVTESFLKDEEDKVREGVSVVGRRSRKEWECAAKDECSLNGLIDLDEVYVEVAEEVEYVTGRAPHRPTFRFHMPCAMRAHVIEKVADAVDKGNNRRAAIAMTKAKREAAGEC
jgi:hypothetical protein